VKSSYIIEIFLIFLDKFYSGILKRFLLFSLIVFLGCSKTTKNGEKVLSPQDSISYYIQKAGDESLPDSEKFKINTKALELTQKQSNDSLNFINYFFISFQYYNLGKTYEYKKTLQKTLLLAEKEKDSVNLARAYSYLGDYYYEAFKSDSAFYNYYQAEKVYFKLKSNLNIGRMYLKKATAQFRERDYIGSEKSAVTALGYIRLEPDKYIEFDAYNVLGLNCLDIKDYDKALEYFTKALKITQEHELPAIFQAETLCLSNIGLVFQKKNNHIEAVRFFEKALNNQNLYYEYPYLYASLVDNLSYSKFKLNQKKGVLEGFYEALRIKDSVQNYTGIVQNKIHISEYYLDRKEPDSALKYAINAHEMAKNTKILNLQLLTLQQLGSVIPERNVEFSQEYIKLSDSLQNAERRVSEKFARIEYETDEIKQEREKLAIQNRNIIFISLLAFLIIALLFVVRIQKNRNQRLQLIQSQQVANEEIYNLMLNQQKKMDQLVQNEKKRIAQELHDGVLGRLFGARLNLDSLNKRMDDEAAISRNNYISELQNIEQDIREISHDLNREKNALINNFLAIITNLFEEQKIVNPAKLTTVLDTKINWDAVGNTIKINLYRIIQESFQNINKYANAKHVKLELKKEDNTIKLYIEDDGVGFDSNKKAKGIGLENMQSRVDAVEGTFDIKSKINKGTKTYVTIPL
jgi:signal transduction histidine kinase